MIKILKISFLVIVILDLSCCSLQTKKGDSSLMKAVKMGDLIKAKELIKKGANVNYRNEIAYTALLIASERGNLKMVKLLLKHKADVNRKSSSFLINKSAYPPKNYHSSLMKAIWNKHFEVAKLLIQNGAEVNFPDCFYLGETPLMAACKSGNEEIVKLLIKKGANINYLGLEASPLKEAIINKKLRIIRLLLRYKVYVSTVFESEEDFKNYSKLLKGLDQKTKKHLKKSWLLEQAMFKACEKGNNLKLKSLLKKTGKINLYDRDRKSLLMRAAERGHFRIVKYLIRKGVDLNFGWKTASFFARKNKHRKILSFIEKNNFDKQFYNASKVGNFKKAKLLINKNLNFKFLKDDCSNALLIALKNKHPRIARLILEKKIDVNHKDNYQKITALMWAVKYGYLDIVKILVEKGAIVNYMNTDNEVALMWASAHGNFKIVDFLLKNGANLNARNDKGETALDYAKEKGYKKIIALLKKYGAK